MRYGLRVGGNGGRNVNFVNGEKSINNYTNLDFNLNMGYDFPDKYGFEFGPRIGHNSSKSSLRSSINNNYFIYGGRFEGSVTFPGKIEFNTDINFDMRQRIAAYSTNTNIITWNAGIDKKLFKDKSGKIGFYANDILNQNKGYTRTINSNFVSDESYLKISRYFLLKLEWTFNKMPGAK